MRELDKFFLPSKSENFGRCNFNMSQMEKESSGRCKKSANHETKKRFCKYNRSMTNADRTATAVKHPERLLKIQQQLKDDVGRRQKCSSQHSNRKFGRKHPTAMKTVKGKDNIIESSSKYYWDQVITEPPRKRKAYEQKTSSEMKIDWMRKTSFPGENREKEAVK